MIEYLDLPMPYLIGVPSVLWSKI